MATLYGRNSEHYHLNIIEHYYLKSVNRYPYGTTWASYETVWAVRDLNLPENPIKFLRTRSVLGDLTEKVSRQRSGQRVSLFNQLKQGLLPGNS